MADGGELPGAAGQAEQPVLAAELADFLWRRLEPGRDQLTPSAAGRGNGQDPGMWRDQLLAEIENLARTLREKVARYSAARPGLASVRGVEPANRNAVVWIQDALEDIAATALGIEIASRALFLQAAWAGDRDPVSETAREQSAGTAD